MPITVCILSLVNGLQERMVILSHADPVRVVTPLRLDNVCSRYVYHIA